MTEEISSSSFAKKYRPILLRDLIGQDRAKKQIAGILKSGRIPCAILLTGATGCGKTTIARVIARQINRIKECTPLNDVYEFNIGTNGTMEDIRKLVDSTKYLPNNKLHKKIYILDEVHKLTKASASGLLKEIEEPPAHVLYILCTNEPDKLLETLVNRCEKINLEMYSEDDMIKLLQYVCEQENLKISEEVLRKLAIAGNCQPRECLVTLQGIANLLAGGTELTDEVLEKEIQKAIKNDLFEYSNSFIIALYLKKYSAIVRRVSDCGDPAALLNISVNSTRSLVKYFAALFSNGKWEFKTPFYTKKMVDALREKLGDLKPNEVEKLSAEVHQLVVDSIILSRSVNIDVGDVILTKAASFCYKN